MLAALLTAINPKSGVHRKRQNKRQEERDFREQDPDFKPRPPRAYRVLELLPGTPVELLPETPEPLEDKTAPKEVRARKEKPRAVEPSTTDLQGLMAKAREVGLGDEMARAILEDDEEAIMVILMAVDL